MVHVVKSQRKLLLVEDHPLVIEGLRSVFDRERDLEVCGEASSIGEAMLALATHSPDALIVDVSLGTESGLDLIARVRNDYPELPILVLSMHQEALYAERVLCAGANGYITKHEAPRLIVAAVRQVLTGGMFASPQVTEAILRSLSGARPKPSVGLDRLSNRELEVFRLVGTGLGSSRIAESLHISQKTVETHRARIKEKLGLSSAAELVVKAATWVNSRLLPDSGSA
jgi:DNA-binding NarL/FixJ family response regulator